jgi:hypothetical protein
MQPLSRRNWRIRADTSLRYGTLVVMLIYAVVVDCGSGN